MPNNIKNNTSANTPANDNNPINNTQRTPKSNNPALNAVRKNRQINQDKAAQGWITPMYKPAPRTSVDVRQLDVKAYQKYLGDDYGWIPDMSRKNLDYLNAKNQPTSKVILNMMAPAVPAAIAIIREVGKLWELGELAVTAIGGDPDYVFDNKVIDWSNKLEKEARHNGNYILSKYPDKMVGDFRGFLGMTQQVAISGAIFALEGAAIGGIANVIGRGLLAGLRGLQASRLIPAAVELGNGSKVALGIAKGMKGLAAFAAEGFESVDVAIGSYNRVLADMSQEINPNTGLFYTKEELQDKAELASKRSFLLNQALITGLDMGIVGSYIMPEVSIEKAVQKEINKRIAKGSVKASISGGAKGGVEITDDVIKAAAKKYARAQYGVGKAIWEGGKEGVQELANNWIEEGTVHSAKTNDDLFDSMFDKDVLTTTFGTRESFWTFVSGAIGGAGQIAIVGHTMPSLNNALKGEVTVDANGNPVYIRNDFKNKEQFLNLPSDVEEQLEPDPIYTTLKKPKKPKKLDDNATQQQKDKYEKDLAKYKEDLTKYRTAKWGSSNIIGGLFNSKGTVFTSNNTRIQQEFLALYNNKARLLHNTLQNVSYNSKVLQSELDKKRQGLEYDQSKIDKALHNIYEAGTAYNIKNGSTNLLKEIYNQLENMSQEDAIKLGFAENEDDTQYKERAKDARDSLNKLEAEYNRINRKYFKKGDIIDAYMMDILFDSFSVKLKNKLSKKRLSEKIDALLKEGNVTRQQIDEAISKLTRLVDIDITAAMKKTYREYFNPKPEKGDVTVNEITYNIMRQLERGLNFSNMNNAFRVRDKIYRDKLLELADKVLKEKMNTLMSMSENKQLTNEDKQFYRENEDLINEMLYLYEHEIMEDVLDELDAYMRKSDTLKNMRKYLAKEVGDHINKKMQKKINKEKTKQKKKEAQKQDLINKEKKDAEKSAHSKVDNNKTNKSIEEQVDANFKTIEQLFDKLKNVSDDIVKQFISMNEGLLNLYKDLKEKSHTLSIEQIIMSYKFLLELQEDLIHSIITHEYTVNNITEPDVKTKEINTSEEEQDTKKDESSVYDIFDEKSIKELNDLLQKISDKSKIVGDDDIEYDNALQFSDPKEEKRVRDLFNKLISKMYDKWKSNSKFKNNSHLHYIEFYKVLLNLTKMKYPALLYELYKDNLPALMKEADTPMNLTKIILDEFAKTDENGDIIEMDEVNLNGEDTFDYNNDEVIPVTKTDKEQNDRSVNEANKLVNPSISIAYLERKYVAINSGGKIVFVDTENIREGDIHDKVQVGDEVTLKVVDDDDIPMHDENGKPTTWGEYKKDKGIGEGDEEYNKHIPIIIMKGDEVIGFLHDTSYLDDEERNVAESADIEAEKIRLNKIRKHVIKHGVVKTTIKRKLHGHPNTEMNGKLRTLNEHVPNLNKQRQQIAIFRNGKLQLINGMPFKGNIVNQNFLDNFNPQGNIFMIIPDNTNSSFFAIPVVSPRLGESNMKYLLDSIKSLIYDALFNNQDMNVDDIIEFISSHVYTKSFNMKDIYKGDRINYRYFFNVNKQGNIEFAVTDPSINIPGLMFKKFYINLVGENKGRIIRENQDGTREEIVGEESKKQIVNALMKVLSYKFLNVRIDKKVKGENVLNNEQNKGKYKELLYTKNGKFKTIEYESYYDYLSNLLKTNILEKKVVNEDNSISYSYTIQPTLEIDDNFLNEPFDKRNPNEENSDENENDNDTKVDDKVRENALSDDEDVEWDDAVLYTDNTLDKMSNVIIKTQTGLTYEEEQDLIDILTSKILDRLEKGDIDKNSDIDSYFDNLVDDLKLYIEDNKTSEQEKIKAEIKLNKSIIDNIAYFKKAIISNLLDNTENKELEDEILRDETEELERKPQWDMLLHERDVVEKSTLKLKMLLSTIPKCRFKIENNKVVMKNNKPVIIYTRNSINKKKMQSVQNIIQKMHGLLVDYSTIDDLNKFDTFIQVLENSNDAELYLAAKKLKEADDRTKASFINVTSVRDTNSIMNLFKSEYQYNPLEPEKSGVINKVVSIFNSDNSMIKKIIDDFYINASTNVDSKAVIKKGNKYVLNMEYLDDLEVKIINREFTIDDLKEFLNAIGIQLTDKEFKDTFENTKKVYKMFGRNLYGLNGEIYYMIKNMMNNGDDSNISIVNPLININKKTLRKFAKVKLNSSKRYGVSTFKNGEGNKVQNVSNNVMLSIILGKLKQRKEDGSYSEELNTLLNNNSVLTGEYVNIDGRKLNYFRSFWIENLMMDDNQFDINIEDSMNKWSTYSKAKTKPNQSPEELFVNSVFMFLNNNKKYFRFSPLTFSDKKTSVSVTCPRFKFDFKLFMENGEFMINKFKTSNKLKNALRQYILLPEILRINKHVKAVLNEEVTEESIGAKEFYGSFYFYFTPILNTIKEIRNEDGSIKIDSASINLMTNYMLDVLSDSVEKNIKEFKKLFIKQYESKNKGVVKKIELLDTNYIKRNYKKEDLTDVDNIIEHIAFEYTFNQQLATVEYLKVLDSFPSATFKAKGKGALSSKNFHKYFDIKNKVYNFGKFMKEHGSYTVNAIKSTYGEYMKRMAKSIAPRIDGYWEDSKGRHFNTFTQMYITEPITDRYDEKYKKQGVEGYNQVEGSDAAEQITFKEFIVNAHAYSNISDDLYNDIMDAIEKNEEENRKIISQMEASGATHEEVLKAMKSLKLSEDIKSKLNVTNTKPVYAGKVWNTVLGKYTSRYIKVSSLPLETSITSNTAMDMLRRHAEYIEAKYDTTVRISMVSGVKEGANNIQNVWNYDKKSGSLVPNMETISKLTGEVLDRSGLGIQLEESVTEVKTRINIATQANKLMFVGLLTGFNTKDGSMEGFVWDKDDKNEKGEVNTKSALEIKEIKESIRKKMVDIEVNKLADKLGLKVSNGSKFSLNDNTKGGRRKFIKKLHKLIKEEMKERNYNFNDLLAIELIEGENDFRFPLDFIPSSQKIEALLLSIITNRIIKTKIPGKNYINVPGVGIMTYTGNEEYANEIVYTDKYDGKSLKYIEFNDDGQTIEYAQCFVPFNFTDSEGKLLDVRDYMEEKDGKYFINKDKVDDELLKLIGLRIPNQGHSSMLTLEIVGFLPNHVKNIILLPPEITSQMGSDNDYDHIFTYSYNTNLMLEKEVVKDIQNEVNDKFSYDNYKGDEEYMNNKKELDRLNIKYSDENVKDIKLTLNKEELNLFNSLLEDDDKDIYEFEKKPRNEQTELESSLISKMEDFSKKFNQRKKDNKELIGTLRTKLKTERDNKKKSEFKKRIKQKKKEEGKLTKLTYDKNISNVNNNLELQNAYVDIFHTVLSHPEVAKKMITKLDAPYLADEAEMLDKILNTNNEFNPLSIEYAIQSYRNNQAGKIGVAIQSLVSTFLSLIEDKNLILNDETVKNNPITIQIGDKEYTMKSLGIGSNTMINGKTLTNVLFNQMLQNETVDNAKNLNLSKINYNSHTAPFYNALLVMNDEKGYSIPMESLTRLMTQEVMQLYVKNMLNSGSFIGDMSYRKANQILNDIKLQMEGKFLKLSRLSPETEIEYKDFKLKTPEELLKLINGKKDADYYLYQAKLANWLKKIYNDYVFPINSLILSVSTVDSKSIGKNMIEMLNRYENIIQNINNSVVPNAYRIFNHNNKSTETGHIFNSSFYMAYNLYLSDKILGKPLFGYENEIYKSLNSILNFDYSITNLYIEDKKKIWEGFKKYMMSRALSDTGINVTEKRKELLFGLNSLAVRTLNYKEKDWFKSNDFLSQLKVNLNDNKVVMENKIVTKVDENPMYVEFDSWIKDSNKDYNNISSLFKLLIDTNKKLNIDPNNKELIEILDYLQDLIDYTILEGGVQNAHNWMKYIHPLYLEETGLLYQLRNYQKNVEVEEVKWIVEQILKHNPNILRNVKNIKNYKKLLSIKKDKKKNIISISFDEQIIENLEDGHDLYILKHRPLMIRHYNKDTKHMEILKLQETVDDTITYIQVNPKGSEKLGTDEYSTDTINTILPENMVVSPETEEVITRGNIQNSNIIESENKTEHFEIYEKEPSLESVFDIINDLAKTDGKFSIPAQILQNFKNLFSDSLFYTTGWGERARHGFNKNTFKTLKLGIDMNILRNKHDNIEDLNNEFDELLIHEMLHSVFKQFELKIKNNTLNDKEKVIYNKLENLRIFILNKKIKDNPELWEQYKQYKNNKENNIETSIDKTALMLFEPYSNVSEMLSYGWTDSDVQEDMKNIKYENTTTLEKFKLVLQEILNNIAKAFGIKDRNNALSEFIENSIMLYRKLSESNKAQDPFIEENNDKSPSPIKRPSSIKSNQQKVNDILKQEPYRKLEDEGVIVAENKLEDVYKNMTEVSDASIVETNDRTSKSLLNNSLDEIVSKNNLSVVNKTNKNQINSNTKSLTYYSRKPNYKPKVIMLSRDYDLFEKPLQESTKELIYQYHKEGSVFVIGNMEYIDTQFQNYLLEIGATFTVYNTKSNNQILDLQGNDITDKYSQKEIQEFKDKVELNKIKKTNISKQETINENKEDNFKYPNDNIKYDNAIEFNESMKKIEDIIKDAHKNC